MNTVAVVTITKHELLESIQRLVADYQSRDEWCLYDALSLEACARDIRNILDEEPNEILSAKMARLAADIRDVTNDTFHPVSDRNKADLLRIAEEMIA